jgi:hypothetical protein
MRTKPVGGLRKMSSWWVYKDKFVDSHVGNVLIEGS